MILFVLIVTLPLFRVPQYAWAAVMRITSVRWACILACLPWAFLVLVYFEMATPIEAAFARLSQNALDRLPIELGALNLGNASDAPFLIIMFQALSALASLSFYSTIWLGPWHILAALSAQDASSGETSHGSAEWGDVAAAVRAGNIWPKDYVGGLLLGRMWQKKFPKTKDPRYRVCRHVLTCAPTGAGKGVGCVIPNLLAYPGSVVCLDVKGENFAVTAQVRRDMGQDVWCLDPFGVTGEAGHSLNWLDAIDLNRDSCVGDAAALAETLVVRGAGQDSFWDDAAANLIQGVVLYAASLPIPERHMGSVRRLLTLPEAEMTEAMGAVAQMQSLAFGIAGRIAGSFLGKSDRERSAVLSTAQRHTAFLDDPRIDRALRSTHIDFASLKDRPQTVYIVLPPDKLVAYGRFARATLGLAMQAMMQRPGLPTHDVVFVLDEFAQLGHFAAVENNIAILRGYGVSLWLLVQDLSQLRGVYAKWETFLANTVLQAFATQDMHTARYLSEMLGQATLQVASSSKSQSWSHRGDASSGTNEGISPHARLLMTPDEVRRVSAHQVLVFEQGQPPQRLLRLDYRTDPESCAVLPQNPMYDAPGGRLRSDTSKPVLRDV
jgi:type IV secretion system protein VirD4